MSEFRQRTRPDDEAGAGSGPGWDAPAWNGEPSEAPGARGPDLSALLLVVEGLRRLLPPELRGQFTALLRELLLTLRALIDWYLERLEGGDREPAVEDIPIE